MDKICSKCGISKNLSEFDKRPSRKSNVRPDCKKCRSEYQKNNRPVIAKYEEEYRMKNKEHIKEVKREYTKANSRKFKSIRMQKSFGITIEQYESMLASQNDVCFICKKYESKTNKRSGKIIALAIDHDHETGKVRGLLCSNCNTALGLLKEDFNITLNLAKYIQEHKGVI